MPRADPKPETVDRIRRYVEKYREKSGTLGNPDPAVNEAVIMGLAANVDEVGRPLCPCNFYPDKQAEIAEHGRRWFCACDAMTVAKYCHCLIFFNEDGLPITEYLPEDHHARKSYGLVKDPTPDKGRERRHRVPLN